MTIYELRGTAHLNYEIVDDSAYDGPAVFSDFTQALRALKAACADPDALSFAFVLGEYLDENGPEALNTAPAPVAEGRLDLVRVTGDDEEYLLVGTRSWDLAAREATLQHGLTEEGTLTEAERSILQSFSCV